MHTDALTEQAAIAYIAAKLIEWAKNSNRIPWLSQASGDLNRYISIAIALAASAGLTVAWNGTFEAGGTLVITVPSIQSLTEFLLHAISQHLGQKAIYHGLIKEKA